MGFQRTATLFVLTVLVSGCSLPGRFLRGYAAGDDGGMELLEEGGDFAHAPAELQGQVRFLFDDFGSLNTDALENYAMPWKLVGAALVLDRHRTTGEALTRGTFDQILAEYGFFRPRSIANWVGPEPRLDRPLGIVTGQARRSFPTVDVQVANVGCATCHSAPLYGADGRITDQAWLGTPNASVDLAGFADQAFHALRRSVEEPDRLLDAARAVFPRVTEDELSTLQKHIIPAVRDELEIRAESFGGLVPFDNGGPGLTNGVESIRFLFGQMAGEAGHAPSFVQAPDLVGTTMRRSLLVDGVHAAPGSPRFGSMTRDQVDESQIRDLAGIVSIFVLGTQGVTPSQARDAIPAVEDIMRFVDGLETPRFPGAVDTTQALLGRQLYDRDCAVCHGSYGDGLDRPPLLEHPNRLVAQDRMHTDPVRWQAADSAALGSLEEHGFGEVTVPLRTGGYVAPDLSGVWATAPYLHNGSVPTLWHLLSAEERPTRFQVGGHALDYQMMGILGEVAPDGMYRYPESYRPWSRPRIRDTRDPGLSNAGHEFLSLTREEKWALIEYMKVL